MPSDISVRMTKGGTDDERADFAIAVFGLQSSLKLVKVRMPDVSIQNVTVSGVNFQRTSTNGVGLLTVDVMLKSVVIAPSATFGNTSAPSGASQVNNGSVQPQTPTTAQAAAASGST
jgi:hypothetical protein